jgi:hypothetical protein
MFLSDYFIKSLRSVSVVEGQEGDKLLITNYGLMDKSGDEFKNFLINNQPFSFFCFCLIHNVILFSF